MRGIVTVLSIYALMQLCLGCEEEDKLSASNLDVNRVDTLLDWSNAVVKRYY